MSIRRSAAVVTAATLALALLAGCAPSSVNAEGKDPSPNAPLVPLGELEVLADPRGHEGSSTAMLRSSAIDPITESPQQTLPATIMSHDLSGDVEVTVTDTERIVAFDMAGSIAATLAGLGFADRLVGRDVSTTFEGAKDLPVVTSSGHSINIEAVLKLRPTLVITDGSIGPIDVVTQLRDAGVTVVFVERDQNVQGILKLTRQVAAAVGASETGEQLVERLDGEITAKIAEIAEIAPTDPDEQLRVIFLYLRGGSGVYYLFGSESGADALITSLGARDVAAEIGWEGMRPMTDEALIKANPDLILLMTHGLESVGGVEGLFGERPALALTNAGKHQRVVDMADGDILSFGPNFADVLDALARAFYAPGV